MALIAGKKLQERPAKDFSFPLAAAAAGFQGGLVMLDNGFAKKAAPGGSVAAAALLTVVGVAEKAYLGGAGDGDVRVAVRQGVFLMKNSSTIDAIAEADIGKLCYVVDDETVAKTSNFGLRPRAGVIIDVESAGVWVDVAGENAAIGKRSVFLPFYINETDTLAGTACQLVSPVAGRIAEMSVVVQKAVTTGGPVTADVGATPVAGLSCVIANAAAAGTVVTDNPTAGDATTIVAKGSQIQVIPDAAFATAGAISGYVEITY